MKRLFSTQNDWVPTPILGVGGINYEGVLRLNSEDVSFDLNVNCISKVAKSELYQ